MLVGIIEAVEAEEAVIHESAARHGKCEHPIIAKVASYHDVVDSTRVAASMER